MSSLFKKFVFFVYEKIEELPVRIILSEGLLLRSLISLLISIKFSTSERNSYLKSILCFLLLQVFQLAPFQLDDSSRPPQMSVVFAKSE